MSSIPGTIEITYKVPKRRHPVLAFALQQPLGTAGLAVIVLMILLRCSPSGSCPMTR